MDKLAYAAIEATLGSYARGAQFEEIPTLRMLSEPAESILARSERLVSRITDRTTGLDLNVFEGESVIGGGSAPDTKPTTWLIAIVREGRTPEELAESLRRRSVPVIGRISDEKLILDLRTVFEDEEEVLENAIAELAA